MWPVRWCLLPPPRCCMPDSAILWPDLLASTNPEAAVSRESLAQLLQQLYNLMLGMKWTGPWAWTMCTHARTLWLPALTLFPVSTSCYATAKPALFSAYDTHIQLHQLSYFNVLGRMRLSMQLLRHLLSVPLLINEPVGHRLAPWAIVLLQRLTSILESGEGGCGKVESVLRRPWSCLRSARPSAR